MASCAETRLPPARPPGGKAARLAELRDAGFAVPEFVVSPVDAATAAAQLGLPLAVRSSAAVEDGLAASFAGQFRSFLGLGTIGEVERAIARVRASGRSRRVRGYARRHGVDPAGLRMEVIVQRMVDPELSGAAFTVDPATGAERVVIEACAGLADELLAGRQAPLADDHPLTAKHRGAIEAAARAVQRHFGAPQDVEFAIEDNQIFILQSRPITRIQFADEPGEWTSADFRDGGVSSGVCTPLMWSLYELAWNDALKGTLRELKLLDRDFVAGRQFFGRPYWNLGEVKRCVARLPGFVERSFDEDLSVEIQYDGAGACTPLTLGTVARAIPTLWAARRFLKRQQRAAEQFLAGGFEQLAARCEARAPNGGADARDWLQLVEQDYLAVEGRYFRTIFAASLAKLDFLSAFPAATDRTLLAALEPLAHMAPVRAVQALSERTDAPLRAIVRRYRHHCRLGLDVCQPRWDEDEEFVVAMLRGLPRSAGCDPRPAYRQARAEALAAVLLLRRRAFARKLDRLRRLVWLREELRDLSSRFYWLLRRRALAIAAARGLGDDVFFMSYRELAADDRSHVAGNREIYESYRNFQAPNEIGRRYRGEPAPPDEGALRGIAASGGAALGRAFVARDVRAASAMPAGSVLVCPFTDPGWTPVLDRAAAVVAETGGLLSHAAVICREYGVPAVLGVRGATARIRHGQWILVHGNEGHVQLDPVHV